jgi:hypothetical protein
MTNAALNQDYPTMVSYHSEVMKYPKNLVTRCFAEFTLRIENIEGLSMTRRRKYAVTD